MNEVMIFYMGLKKIESFDINSNKLNLLDHVNSFNVSVSGINNVNNKINNPLLVENYQFDDESIATHRGR